MASFIFACFRLPMYSKPHRAGSPLLRGMHPTSIRELGDLSFPIVENPTSRREISEVRWGPQTDSDEGRSGGHPAILLRGTLHSSSPAGRIQVTFISASKSLASLTAQEVECLHTL